MQVNHEIKVGLFTLMALGVLGYMFFVLNPNMFKSQKESSYFTILKNASGIIPKTHVKVSGVIVGKVTDVALRGSQTRIDFTVEEGLSLPVGTEITVREKGLLGDVFLEIIRAEDNGTQIPVGSLVPPAKDQFTLSKLIDIAGHIGRDIQAMTGPLSEVLGGKDGKSGLEALFVDLKSIAKNLKGVLLENREGIREIVQNLRESTTSINNVVGAKESDLGEIIDNIKTTTAALKDLLREDNQEKLNRIIAGVDRTLVDLEQTASDLRLIANRVEEGQGTLGKLINSDATLTEIEGAVKDVRELIAPANKMHVFVDYHGEYRGSQSAQHFFELRLQPRPDKYYLIGATDVIKTSKETVTEDIELESEDISDDAISSTKKREKIVERNSLRFNIQYAKRWWFAQFRLGLFQSTGGIGADLFALGDALRFSIEAFDWRRSPFRNYARIKSYVSILFFNHLYLMVGADELTKLDPVSGARKRPEFFAGAGIVFSDDDLRSLFGLAAASL